MAFTNERLIELSPVVCSRFGLIAIMLWGLAYWSVASSYKAVPALVSVFSIEKLIYVVTWFFWLGQHFHELPNLYAESPLTAIFYSLYGPIDIAFGVFFAVVALQLGRIQPPVKQ